MRGSPVRVRPVAQKESPAFTPVGGSIKKTCAFAWMFVRRGLREVVQPGGMPALGAGGRRFESCLPDKIKFSVHFVLLPVFFIGLLSVYFGWLFVFLSVYCLFSQCKGTIAGIGVVPFRHHLTLSGIIWYTLALYVPAKGSLWYIYLKSFAYIPYCGRREQFHVFRSQLTQSLFMFFVTKPAEESPTAHTRTVCQLGTGHWFVFWHKAMFWLLDESLESNSGQRKKESGRTIFGKTDNA